MTAAFRTLSLRCVIALLICAIATTGAIVAANRYIDSKIAAIPRISLATATSPGHGTNYLVIGSDSRSFVNNAGAAAAFGTSADTGPARSDTMMVLHVDGANSFGLSFPRDLWVDIPGRGKAKINAAFNDGPQKVIDTLKQNFGVDIDHYLEVNFVAFQAIVDAIGSVPVYFDYPTRDHDPQGNGDTGFNAFLGGCYHLDGAGALSYVRSRHLQELRNGQWVSVDPLSDLDRIQRQQAFIKELVRLATQRVFASPGIGPGLVDDVTPELTVDQAFGRGAFNELATAFRAVGEGNAQGFQFTTLPWTAGSAGGQSVLFEDTAAAAPLIAGLQGGPLPASLAPTPGASGTATTAAPAVRPTDVRVRVLNASGVQGAAGDAETAFGKLGFVNGGVANDPRGLIDHSEVRYHPGDEAKAQLVAASLPGAQLVADSTLSGTDVVVALGKNFTGVGAGSGSSSSATAAPSTTTTTVSPAVAAAAACTAS